MKELSPTTLATKRLTAEARQALRESDAYPLSSVEAALAEALAKLIQAVERSVSNGYGTPTFCLKAEEEESGELEQLYASIQGHRGPAPGNGERRFVIAFPPMELAIDEIWPEGNAPENPTPEDVIEVMKSVQYAHPARVAAEWLLIDKLTVRYHTDKRGEMEVEWHGD